MISKEERERDKAICEAATPGPVAVMLDDEPRIVADGHTIAVVTCCDRARENALALANARDRLPRYIADAEETERQIAEVERQIGAMYDSAARMRRLGAEDDANAVELGVKGMERALQLLRGDL